MNFDINGRLLRSADASETMMQNGLISHRGVNTAPENTLPAIQEAISEGFKHVEIDLNWTSDNVCVLLHDSTIDRTSDGSGNIGSMTLETVRQYDFGSWKNSNYVGTTIPTLREALMLCKSKNVAVQLDIASKNPSNANLQSMINDIIACGMNRNVNVCCYADTAIKVDSMYKGIPFCLGIKGHTIDTLAEAVKGINMVCLSTQYSSYSTETTLAAHAKGWLVQTWTVNDADTANSVFLGGCDWILTDSLKPNQLT